MPAGQLACSEAPLKSIPPGETGAKARAAMRANIDRVEARQKVLRARAVARRRAALDLDKARVQRDRVQQEVTKNEWQVAEL